MTIPLTHRDSRPRTQAEQDQEESFDVRKRLKLPGSRPNELAQKLAHFQEMFTRLIEDAAFRDGLTWETAYLSERQEHPKRPKRRKRLPNASPSFFTYLDELNLSL